VNPGRRPAPALTTLLTTLVWSGAGTGLAAAEEPGLAGLSSAELGVARRPGPDEGFEQPELEINLEVASAYVFRGYNVFQAQNQREQNWVQGLLLAWNPPGSGFSVGYASANQLRGDNLVSNVQAGLGGEEDVFAGYELARQKRLGLATELAVVAYPLADSSVVGTRVPLIISVSAEPRYRRNLYFYLGYLRGFRHGLFEGDQIYLNPHVEKKIDLGERFELDLAAGAGVKLLQVDVGVVKDNMFDVLATATLYCALNDVFYVGAKVGWAWTNVTSRRDPMTGQSINARFADEYVPFWAVSLGAEFSPGVSVKPSGQKRRAHAM
jgi:hypothetical protein